jgi:NitT/TauT family transport system substrate-binding protein
MKSSKFAWTALTAAVLVLSTACGGSEGGGLSDAPAKGSSDSGGGNGKLTSLTMAETPGGPLSFIAYGIQKGYFKDEGIDLTVKPNPGGGTSSVPALLQGDFDVMGLDLVSAITSIQAGLPLKMVAAGSATSDDAKGDFAGVLVKADSPIKGPEDFKGIKMGVNALGNINELAIDSTLEAQKQPKDAISPVELPFPEILAAIGRGDIQAGILIEPFVTIGEKQGLRVVYRPWVGIKPGLQIGTMVMSDAKIKENPKVVDGFARAVKKTADDIRKDPGAFRKAMPTLIQIDPALADSINLIQWRGESDMDSIKLTGRLMVKYGLLDKEINYDKAVLH